MTIEAQRPSTAVEVLTRVIERDDSPVSATTARRQEHDPVPLPRKACAEYLDALTVAGESMLGAAGVARGRLLAIRIPASCASVRPTSMRSSTPTPSQASTSSLNQWRSRRPTCSALGRTRRAHPLPHRASARRGSDRTVVALLARSEPQVPRVPARGPRSGRSARRSTTHWPKRRSGSSTSNCSHRAAPGGPVTRSRSPSWNGSTGTTTTAVRTNNYGDVPPVNVRQPATVNTSTSPRPGHQRTESPDSPGRCHACCRQPPAPASFARESNAIGGISSSA